jgi:DNA polymerase-3 subunit delta
MIDPAKPLLDRGGLGGVFYLHGDDEFRKGQAVRSLVDAHLDPGTRDFNLDRLRGKDVASEHLASVLGTPPMMAEWRVVVVTEVEAFAGSPKAREVLLSVMKTPPPGLALILSCTKPTGSRAKFYSQLASTARSLEFRPLSQDDVPGWLMERAAEAWGVEMEPAAARALAQAVGTDLGILNQEIEKLAGYVQDGRPITRDDVEAAGTSLPKQDRWSWIDLVGQRRFQEALGTLGVLVGQGESGVGLSISLATHFLRLGVLVDRGPQALEKALPPNQRWLARQLQSQAGAWSSREIADALDGLRLLDRRLKSSSVPDESLLQSWLLERMVARA